MKKLFALLLVAALLVTLGACAAKEPNNTASDSSATETVDPLTLLETVWNSFSEDEKFPAVGGDLSEENLKDGAPGKYVITDAAELDRVMGFPQTEVASVKAAAHTSLRPAWTPLHWVRRLRRTSRAASGCAASRTSWSWPLPAAA